jgi:hypothetical protein
MFMLLLVLFCGLNVFASENLLINGSFEGGSFAFEYLDEVPIGWNWTYWPAHSGSFWVTNEDSYDGDYSVKLIGRSQWRDGTKTAELCHFFQLQTLEPGKTYTVLAYIKPLQGDPSMAVIGLILRNGSDQNHYYTNGRLEKIGGGSTAAQDGVILESVECEHGWFKHRIVFTTPAKRIEQYQVRVVVWGSEPHPKPDNIALVDNVQLYEGIVD